MKAILEFDLPEEREEFEMATSATKMSIALHRIYHEIFRPARKHGYGDENIHKLLTNETAEFTQLLETKFFEILREENIEDMV